MRNGARWTAASGTTARAIACLAMLGGEVCDAAETSTATSRVRSTDRALVELIEQGARGSDTFRRLVAAIQTSNGIVYVEPGTCSHGVRACLQMWMLVSGPDRFLRVLVDRQKADSAVELTGLIGHELQHVIEALSEPAVTNGAMLYNFFRRYAPTDDNRFETTAAVNAGNTIRDELRTKRRR